MNETRTVWVVVREGKIELLENLSLTEGARVLVTLMPDEYEQQFWMSASERSALRFTRESDRAERFGKTLRMTSMPNYSKNKVILVQYPFSDLYAPC